MNRYQAAEILAQANIPTTVIYDSGVAAVMERVDIVLVGAEGVMENGGVVNKVSLLITSPCIWITCQIGTCQLGICAKVANKPFYVAVESYKFARMYPLTQRDIKSMCRANTLSKQLPPNLPPGVEVASFPIDFTPPEFITLLLTDLGVLTPAAVSDELIRLYQ